MPAHDKPTRETAGLRGPSGSRAFVFPPVPKRDEAKFPAYWSRFPSNLGFFRWTGSQLRAGAKSAARLWNICFLAFS
jgi:hypothetical protein